MKFNYIDVENWKRKAHYRHYLDDIPCTYSMTTKLDVTKIVKEQKKIYPTMLYHITKIVNRYEEFRTALDSEGKVGYFDEMLPCYTVFHKESETFSNIWTEYSEDYEVFCKNYRDGEKYLMPISIQVHHSVCDGFHFCRFLDSLRKSLGE